MIAWIAALTDHRCNTWSTMTSAEMTTFETLPTEVLQLVFEVCDVRTLKSLRQSTRFVHELVTPRIFDTVYLGLFDYSIANLINIAQSDVLRQHPQTIIFCGTNVAEVSFQRFKMHVDIVGAADFQKTLHWNWVEQEERMDARLRQSKRDTWNQKEEVKSAGSMRAWDRYRSLVAQYQRWTIDPTLFDIVQMAISRLENIQVLTVPEANPRITRVQPEPLWTNLWVQTHCALAWTRLDTHPDDNVVAAQLLLKALLSCHDRQSMDVNLSISGPRFWAYFLRNPRPLLPPRPFENVLKLTLDISINHWHHVAQRTASLRLALWLNCTPKLEQLHLRVVNPGGPACRVLNGIEATAMPRLISLTLEVAASTKELIRFLKGRKTIQLLRFGDCMMIKASWEKFLTRLPLLLPDLNELFVHGPLHAPDTTPQRKSMHTLLGYQTWCDSYDRYARYVGPCPSFDAGEWLPKELLWREQHGIEPLWEVPSKPATEVDEEENEEEYTELQ